MTAPNLCCITNPDNKCHLCGGSFCTRHVYLTRDDFYPPLKEFTCTGCYDASVRTPALYSERYGLTFKQLYHAARKLVPQGYLTVEVAIQDGCPGRYPFGFKWKIYHEDYGLCEGETPELALSVFQEVITTSVKQMGKPLKQIDA